jgi:hypothetical protein
MGLLAAPIVNHIIGRLRGAKAQLARLAARVAAGTFAPRRVAARPRPDPVKPRPQIPRRRPFGWLRPLLPDAVPAAGYLEHLLQDPAMVALMRTAPAQVARIVRPLCWMLRMKPPPILARPRPKPVPPEAPPAPESAPPRPLRSRPSPPVAPPRPARRHARICGPPRPA